MFPVASCSSIVVANYCLLALPSAPIGSEFSNDKARILEMGVQVSDLASEWEGHTLRIFQGIRGVLIGSLNGVRVMGNRKQHFGEQGESLQDNT